ncbi:hypothetical protein ABT160_16840 [Streptomyces sp. NPDC001941]|uniref:hypothetical protein n=1 Tax=Streptomyces sp. NPDC001941 TaxID=3154659 RepID=UPI00332ED167
MNRSTLRSTARPGPRPRRYVPAVALLLALTGCGVSTTGPLRVGPAAAGAHSPGADSYAAALYFFSPYGLWRVLRPSDAPVGPQAAIDLLLEGPDREERERGLISLVPPMKGQVNAVPSRGAVDISLPVRIAQLENVAVSQLACTAANAAGIPGGKSPTEVLVRFQEPGEAGTWDVRCDGGGNAYPVGTRPDAAKPSPSGG